MNNESGTAAANVGTQQAATSGVTLADTQQFSGYAAPFQILLLTERDCNAQLAELGVSPATLAADMKSLNTETMKACEPFKDLPNVDDHYLKYAHEVVCVRLANDQSRSGYWALVACRAALDYFKVSQDKNKHELNATSVRLALFAQNMMNVAWRPKRLSELERIAYEALAFANHFAEKKKANEVQLKKAQKAQANERSEKAKSARTLATETLYPEWKKSHPHERAMAGYRHCADVLTGRGYKNANGAPITKDTVKAYFRKPKKAP